MQEILDFVHGIDPLLMGLLGFLVGTLVGNWIAIGRDKRKEFNDVAKPVRATLLGICRNPGGAGRAVSPTDLDVLDHYLSAYRRWRLHAAVKQYEDTRAAQLRRDSAGGSHYEDPAAIGAAAALVLRHLSLR